LATFAESFTIAATLIGDLDGREIREGSWGDSENDTGSVLVIAMVIGIVMLS
jgi:hypothetical protein